MSYTFVKVTTFYGRYLDRFFEVRPELAGQSYETQLRALLDDAFGWSDFYARNLNALGARAHEIVANARPLQEQWLKERAPGTPFEPKDTALQQVAALNPEVLFVEDCGEFNGAWIEAARKACPRLKLVIGYHCVPLSARLLQLLEPCDLLASCHGGFCDQMRAAGFEALQLNHAFEESVLARIAAGPASPRPLTFVGSVHLGPGYHGQRAAILRALLDADIGLTAYGSVQRAAVGRNPLRLFARLLPDPLASTFAKPVYGLDMYRVLAASGVSFNNHIDAAGRLAANMRLFEATGVGSCLLTDHKENIRDFFEPDIEVVTYRSAAECVEKARWLLDHPAERAAIARAGQKRTLERHSYRQRAAQLQEAILARL